MKKNLILLGMMAVGKSTIGRIIAKKQKYKFIDTDLKIEEKNSMTINEIFKRKGEKFFRMEEEKVVLNSLEKEEHVIALGGGSFLNRNIKRVIKIVITKLRQEIKTQRLNRLNILKNLIKCTAKKHTK